MEAFSLLVASARDRAKGRGRQLPLHQSAQVCASSNATPSPVDLIIIPSPECRYEIITCPLSEVWGHGRHYRVAPAPSWIMEQGFHLNDKQNDLETPKRSVAPAPPPLPTRLPFLCCHMKMSIMQNEGREIVVRASRELICVSPRHVGQL